jgi:hypothetical protein
MNLTDMKVPAPAPLGVEYAPEMPKEEYPYGLRVSFEDKALEALELDVADFAVGDKIALTAVCEVCSISSNSSGSGSYDRLELQIQKVALGKPGKGKTITDAMDEVKEERRLK